MIGKHIPRDGRQMEVGQMGDRHLVNVVALMLRDLKKLNKMATSKPDVSAFYQALYKIAPMDPHEAGIQARYLVERLLPYIGELYLRGNLDMRDALIEALGRDGQIGGGYDDEILAALPVGVKEDTPWFRDEDVIDRHHEIG